MESDRTGRARARVARLDNADRLVTIALRVLAGVIIVMLLVLNLRLSTRVDSVRDLARQNACIARLEAGFATAVGDALAAPPAPNTSRLEATSAIKAAADRLRSLDESCR